MRTMENTEESDNIVLRLDPPQRDRGHKSDGLVEVISIALCKVLLCPSTGLVPRYVGSKAETGSEDIQCSTQ